MATERRGIALAGNWIIDKVKMVDKYPKAGTLTNVRGQTVIGTGGSPYNCLIDIANLKLGIPLQAIGLVGDDHDGNQIINHVREVGGADVSQMQKTGEQPTSTTDVMTDMAGGERTFFHNRGANALFSRQHVDVKKIWCKIFHIGYILLLDALDAPDEHYGTQMAHLLHDIQQQGIKTSVDVVSEDSDRFARLVTPTLPYIDYLILNEIEAGATTGHVIRLPDRTIDTQALRASAAALAQIFRGELICIHFPEGAYLLAASGQEYYQSSQLVPDSDIKGKTGCGDAFCSGVLVGLHENYGYQESMKLGVFCATACLSHPTSTGGSRPMKEILALGDAYPYRKPLVDVPNHPKAKVCMEE